MRARPHLTTSNDQEPAMPLDSCLRRRSVALLGALAASAAMLAAAAPSALAAFGIDTFSAGPTANARTPDPGVAGAHPDLQLAFTINQSSPFSPPDGTLRTVKITLPPGLIANPEGVPTCSEADFHEFAGCPGDTQVGDGSGKVSPFPFPLPLRVFNLTPSPGEPARLGLSLFSFAIGEIVAHVTPDGDYAITTTASELRAGNPVQALTLNLWGVPGDHGTGAPAVPFVTNPTRCDFTPVTTLSVDSYENPGQFDTRTVSSPSPTGCDSLAFNPSISVHPDSSRAAGSSTSLGVDIMVQQNDDPNGRAPSTLKQATVVLPEGVSINPGLAHDLTACTDGAFGLHNGQPSQCPAGSKIGVVGIDTPLLSDPMPGDIYVGTPEPGSPFRIFVYATGHGAVVKLEGQIIPDPKTGRLTAVFDDNPPIPFSRFHLEFQGGSQAAIALPTTCGPKATNASFAPWSGQPATGSSSVFQVYADQQGSPCPGPQPFKPSFTAGSTNPQAGADTGFTLTFGRDDGDQTLKSLKASLPAGLLGRLSSIPQCPNALADAVKCPDASLLGDVVVSAGTKDSLLNIAGKVWLTEPVSPGQIAGLAIFVPAAAGPYYLGNVVVHAGLYVEPDASIDVLSDPLPTILQGVPLRVRQVTVNLSRPGFMFNPTSCKAQTVSATITSNGGVDAPVSVPFGVRGCADLPFHPQMDVGTAAPSKAGGTTGVDVNVRQSSGEANLESVQLTLPKAIGARLEGPVQTPCEIADWYKGQCDDASRVGHATATTPILSFPLAGDVHFVKSPGGGLPKLGIVLTGGPVKIPLLGDVEVVDGRLRTTIAGIPDAPISRFELVLDGGTDAALSAGDLCSGRQTADLVATAQSGKVFKDAIRLDVLGCGAKRRHRARHAHGHGHRRAKG